MIARDGVCSNGTPGAANPLLDALDRARRIRLLVRQIAARAPHFRGLVYTQRRDLGELLDLTGAVDADVLAMLDALPRNVDDLLHYASGGTHDAHEQINRPARAGHLDAAADVPKTDDDPPPAQDRS